MHDGSSGLNEEGIPADVLPRVRTWWDRQIAHLQRVHGSGWPNVRDWLVDYLNAEVRERLEQKKGA